MRDLAPDSGAKSRTRFDKLWSIFSGGAKCGGDGADRVRGNAVRPFGLVGGAVLGIYSSGLTMLAAGVRIPDGLPR